MTNRAKVVFFKVSSLRRNRHATRLSKTCIETRRSTASDRSANKVGTWIFFNLKGIKLSSKRDETLFSPKNEASNRKISSQLISQST